MLNSIEKKKPGRDFICVDLTLTFDEIKPNNIIVNYNSVHVKKELFASSGKKLYSLVIFRNSDSVNLVKDQKSAHL